MNSKQFSSIALWKRIEEIYGQVPLLIKSVLQINGFDSFLALKGIRYDDKNDFFAQLEETVIDVLKDKSDETEEKKILESSLSNNNGQNTFKFKLRPGHRNLIMNLMLEIDKVDAEDFFGGSYYMLQEQENNNNHTEVAKEECVVVKNNSNTVSNTSSLDTDAVEQEAFNQDHIYSHDDAQNEEEYILEEYLSSEDKETKPVIIPIPTLKMEYYDSESVPYELMETEPKARRNKSSRKRKPDRMYNEEFIAKSLNPRRRRVSSKKLYSQTDDGIRERFGDLIQQSIECILTRKQIIELQDIELVIQKDSDTVWTVTCPLCETRIRLAVVYESGGKYCNYKRSNFERHLRFKHCKAVTKDHENSLDSIEDVTN